MATRHKKERKVNITLIRRVVQTLFFILLIFGGFFITVQHIDSAFMPFVKPPEGVVKSENLDPKTQYDQVFDTYFPTRTCRYIGSETRTFRACAMHFMTEVPIYGVPLYDFLPHILFFVVLAFIFSRFMCGWMCPLGAFQDFLAWIRKILGLNYLKLPKFFLKIFEKFRYVWLTFLFIMAVAIILPFIADNKLLQQDLNLITCNTCPGRIIFPFLTGDIPKLYLFDSPASFIISIVAISFLIIFALSFFGKRLWCQICPTGALLSLFNKGGGITKVKDAKKCTKCGVCERVCPMNNKKVYEEKSKTIVNSYNCINCFKCVDMCPEDDCLQVKFFGITIFRSKYDKKKHDEKNLKYD